jgi:D-inositol-3-phosphate glycosyltransferase
LVDGHEPHAWADALARVISDEPLRRRLEAGALAHAQQFSWEHTAERMLDAYERARVDLRAIA